MKKREAILGGGGSMRGSSSEKRMNTWFLEASFGASNLKGRSRLSSDSYAIRMSDGRQFGRTELGRNLVLGGGLTKQHFENSD